MKQTMKFREVSNVAEHRGMIPAGVYPIELYTEARIAEFDEADRELARLLQRKKPQRSFVAGEVFRHQETVA